MTVGILAGAFNPVTRAHLALVDAGLQVVDEVVCVVPRAYPHKTFEGADFEDRLTMLRAAARRYEIATTEGGLFIEIAREIRRARRLSTADEIYFLCGRDAAERILGWDYGAPDAAARMLKEFRLLVAARHGEFTAPEQFKSRVRPLRIAGGFDDLSSTEVRRRIATGEPWEHLVPEAMIDLVRRIYKTGD